MTKVRLHPALVQYRQDMAAVVDQVRREHMTAGSEPCSCQKPVRAQRDVVSSEPRLAGLLKPPGIEVLALSIFIRHGRLDGVIQVTTSDEFGIVDLYVIISDAQGNRIESGPGMTDNECPGYWGYIPTARVPSGISVTVRVVVIDRLGGMGTRSESTTVR